MIYNTEHTDINDTLTPFNLVHANIKFTIAVETQNKVN
jgi:hypothetical protein